MTMNRRFDSIFRVLTCLSFVLGAKGFTIAKRGTATQLETAHASMKPQANPVVVHSIRPSSRGISVRKLPPPSLQALHEIANYYENKASGDYESLSTRYLFLMIRELRHVLAGLGGDGGGVGGPIPLDSIHRSRAAATTRAMRGSDASTIDTAEFASTADSVYSAPWRHHARSWCEGERSVSTYTESTSAEELRGAIEYLEASLDAAKLHVTHVEQSCQDQIASQSETFRKLIHEERDQFESLYSQNKAECAALVEKAKLETEVIRRDSQAVIAMVQRDAQDTVRTIKSQLEKEKNDIVERHRGEMEAMKAEHMRSRVRMSELLAKAKRDEKDAVCKSRKELIHKHETELLRMRKEAASKALEESKQYEKETVLGPEGIELLARIIQNKDEARDILVESLLEKRDVHKGSRPAPPRYSRNCSKRYRG